MKSNKQPEVITTNNTTESIDIVDQVLNLRSKLMLSLNNQLDTINNQKQDIPINLLNAVQRVIVSCKDEIREREAKNAFNYIDPETDLKLSQLPEFEDYPPF